MKTLFVTIGSLICLTGVVLAQTASAPASPATPSPILSASPAGSPETQLEQSIRRAHQKHFNFLIDNSDSDENGSGKSHHGGDKEIPAMVVPIVAVVFLSIFGAPVLIVAVILYFGFSKSRMQHRTIRMMVEKGQPVPAELLAPPAPAQRQRSDVRKGVVLLMVGIGLIVFCGAASDWESGAWAVGVIPFLIGVGYLLVWKLETKNNVPPPPPVK